MEKIEWPQQTQEIKLPQNKVTQPQATTIRNCLFFGSQAHYLRENSNNTHEMRVMIVNCSFTVYNKLSMRESETRSQGKTQKIVLFIENPYFFSMVPYF